MKSLVIVAFNFSSSNTLHDHSYTRRTCFRFKFSQPINCFSHSRPKITSFGIRKGIYGERLSLFGVNRGDFGILEEVVTKRKKRVVFVRFNGGGWKVDSNTGRILANLALAVGLTYLSLTGQLGCVLDAIVSVWLLAVILPIVGLGAFLWWAGRDIVQGTCPNCKNDFQIFKSMLSDDSQLCPYCSQPFSGAEIIMAYGVIKDYSHETMSTPKLIAVMTTSLNFKPSFMVGDKFVQDAVNFSNQSTTFDQAFGDYFSPHSKQGNDSSTAVVDVEAEIKDSD